MNLNDMQYKLKDTIKDIHQSRIQVLKILLPDFERVNKERKDNWKHTYQTYTQIHYTLAEYIPPILEALGDICNAIEEGTPTDNTTSAITAIEWRYDNGDTDTTATQ